MILKSKGLSSIKISLVKDFLFSSPLTLWWFSRYDCITIEQAKQRRSQWTKDDFRKLVVATSQVVLDANWVKKQFARGTALGRRKTGVADVSLDKFKTELESISQFKGDDDKFITKIAMLDVPPEGILKLLSKVLNGRSWDILYE